MQWSCIGTFVIPLIQFLNCLDMPTIKGFSTKNPNWKDRLFDAINADPDAYFRLPFTANGFVCEKNPFEKLKKGKLKNRKGDDVIIKSKKEKLYGGQAK